MAIASSASRTCSASASASLKTATVASPMRLAVLMMRTAISPRLAMRIFLNMGCRVSAVSQRDVVVLLPRVGELLVAQHRKRAAKPRPCRLRPDNVVDIAARTGDERVGEFLAVLVGARLDLRCVAQIAAEDDLDRAFGAHHRDLGRGPSVVDIATQML